MSFIRRALQFGVQLSNHISFREWLALDRDRACQMLSELVEKMTPAELEAFEREFLEHGIAVVGRDCRLRALELYAFLKIKETIHYRTMPEFVGSSDPL